MIFRSLRLGDFAPLRLFFRRELQAYAVGRTIVLTVPTDSRVSSDQRPWKYSTTPWVTSFVTSVMRRSRGQAR